MEMQVNGVLLICCVVPALKLLFRFPTALSVSILITQCFFNI